MNEDKLDFIGREMSHRWFCIGGALWARLKVPVLISLGGFVLFGAFRLGLLLVRLPYVENLGIGQVLRCFAVGVRFDAMVIGYGLLPMALWVALVPHSWFSRARFRRSVVVYGAALLTLAVTVELLGAAFFLHDGHRLNWLALAHIGHFAELGRYIWRTYPVVLAAVLLAGVYWGLRSVFDRWFRTCDSAAALRPRTRLMLAGLMVCVCVLVCRGGADGVPPRSGSAYFTANKVVSQLSMNNFYTISRAVRQSFRDCSNEDLAYSLPPPDKAGEVAKDMLAEPGQTSLDNSANPIWRRVEGDGEMSDYNVVFIIMESMAGRPVGALGNRPSYTPFLDSLADESVFFERFYAQGPRTSRGLVAILCGHPDVGGQSVLNREPAVGHFLTLPKIFKDRGYRTMFLYGGDPDFDNMREFFSAGGVDEFITQRDMDPLQRPGNWGEPDEQTFDKAHQTFQAMGRQKFFAVILTVSNHEPFDLPPGRVELLKGRPEDVNSINGCRYADWAIEDFFRKARSADYFDRTIFVLVADHGRDFDPARIIDVPQYRIPCLIHAPGLIAPKRVSTIASQVDLAPTVLSLLGGEFEHGFMGRNVLGLAPEEGFAVLREDDRIAFLRNNIVLIQPPRNDAMMFLLDDKSMIPIDSTKLATADRQVMRLQMLSYYALARHLFITGAYRAPNKPQAEVARLSAR